MFEYAAGGCLFLDEIGELPVFLQAKLLQGLQDRFFHRLGGQKEVQVHARVIAATNQNMEAEIRRGNFRDDLYFRLSTVSIHIPPLRERKEDIPLITEHFVQRIQNKTPEVDCSIPDSLMQLFMEYHWPGNVRELENYLNRLSILGNPLELENAIRQNIQLSQKDDETCLNPDQKKNGIFDAGTSRELESFPSLREVREQTIKKVEKEVISRVLHQTRWNRKKTSEILKISYRALLYKIKELNLRP